MRYVVVASVIAVALGFGWLLGSPSAAAPTLKAEPRVKWEYKVVGLNSADSEADWEKALNELGADGWEVVGAPAVTVQVPAAGGGFGGRPGVRVLLKRPK
jgi:hypothetical protein